MQKSLQAKFVHQLLEKFPKRSQAVDELTELLEVGKDAVYRRLKCETPLTPDEMAVIARKYDLSIDELVFDAVDAVAFSYNSFSEPILKFREFLQTIYRDIQEVHVLPDSRFYYTTAEIPVFHYLHFPELISFKLYVWARTIWNFQSLENKLFTFDLVKEEDLKLTDDILSMYNDIPSTELWHLNIVDNTLNQIEYHMKIGGFERSEDAMKLCDRLLELIDHMRLMAKHGCKFKLGDPPPDRPNNNFDLYHNEMVSTNNTFLAITPLKRTIYTTYNTPNFLKCIDPKMCDHTQTWFHQIIGKSISISNHAEKSRSWYFNNLRRKIEQARHRLEMQLEMMGM